MYSLGDVQTSSKGIRSAPLTDATGSSVFIVACADKPLSAPFGASAYNDQAAPRKNICFRCSDEIGRQFESIDQYMAEYIQEHCQRLFKGKPWHTSQRYKRKRTIRPFYAAKSTWPEVACAASGRQCTVVATRPRSSQSVHLSLAYACTGCGSWPASAGSSLR